MLFGLVIMWFDVVLFAMFVYWLIVVFCVGLTCYFGGCVLLRFVFVADLLIAYW